MQRLRKASHCSTCYNTLLKELEVTVHSRGLQIWCEAFVFWPMRIQSGSLQPPEVSSFPGRHLANSRTRCLGKTHLLRDVSVLRLCALSGRWGCLRSRRHFWTHAAATTSSTTERDLSGGFSDGLNGFIPSWAMGMLKARPLPEVNCLHKPRSDVHYR